MIFKEFNWEETRLEYDPKGIDLRGNIYRSKKNLNMEHLSVEMSISAYLIGESNLWIFNRVNEFFDEFTLALKLEKQENSQKIFISLGTFIKDNQEYLVFKTFIKEQLIDFSSK